MPHPYWRGAWRHRTMTDPPTRRERFAPSHRGPALPVTRRRTSGARPPVFARLHPLDIRGQDVPEQLTTGQQSDDFPALGPTTGAASMPRRASSRAASSSGIVGLERRDSARHYIAAPAAPPPVCTSLSPGNASTSSGPAAAWQTFDHVGRRQRAGERCDRLEVRSRVARRRHDKQHDPGAGTRFGIGAVHRSIGAGAIAEAATTPSHRVGAEVGQDRRAGPGSACPPASVPRPPASSLAAVAHPAIGQARVQQLADSLGPACSAASGTSTRPGLRRSASLTCLAGAARPRPPAAA